MLGELDATDFILAENLGKTLVEIGDMPNSEVVAWRAWLKYRAAMSDLNSRAAGAKRKR